VADQTARTEQEGREAAKLVEKMEQRLKVHMDEFAMVQGKHKEEQEAKTKLLSQIHELGGVTKSKREEIKTHTAERDKMQKNFDAMQRKKQMEDEGLQDIERQSAQLKDDLKGMMRQLDRLKTFSERDMKQIQDLRHEHDVLNKNIVKSHDKTKVQKEAVADHEATSTEMREEIKEQKQLLADAMKRAHDMDKQREKYGIELSLQIQKHSHGVEELKNRDNKMSESRKNLSDVRAKLAQQKTAYEGVRTDRNLFSKNLVESQDEIAEMKRKFKIMYHQIEQLKEEIKEKESALIKEHFEHNGQQKKMQQMKDKLERLKKKQQALRQLRASQDSEIRKLETTIMEAEGNRQEQEKEYEEVISQRDILGTQLIRRNDELALLYEKVKIQQNTLQKGEVAYKERVEEIRNLKINVANLNRELEIKGQGVKNNDERKRQVYELQRELLQERTKVKALSEELENPMNVHRWRKLEGSDPSQKEMLAKVKALQRRFIAKTEEAVEKDLLIHEREKLFLELQNILAAQPGPKAADQVSAMQQALKERTKQMKAMAAELNMYHSQVHDHKDDLDRLLRDLQQMKRRFFEQKRRDQLQREATARGDAMKDSTRERPKETKSA
jgi:chromosome segregation ATPase